MHINPFVQFEAWYEEAKAAEPTLPDAVVLASATADGVPAVRMVLVRQYDENGFVFFTNRESRKSSEMDANPKAALLYHWKSLNRQIRIEGKVEVVSEAESKAYFDSRPRGSRLSAWASPQSEEIPNRDFLVDRVAELEQQYPDDNIPLPDFWGGYRVIPERFEFWISRDDRLHDRFLYVQQDDGSWRQSMLGP